MKSPSYNDMTTYFSGVYKDILKPHFPGTKAEYDTLHAVVMENSFIAGGAIRSLIEGTEVNDFDIYFTDLSYAMYVIDRFKQCNFIQYKAETNNAFTFRAKIHGRWQLVQIIIKQSGTPENVIGHFDFTNCMGYYSPNNDSLVIAKDMSKSIESKELVFNLKANTSPLNILKRGKKFKDAGYTISVAEIAKMSYKISTTPLNKFFDFDAEDTYK